jgi:hypothetical protein
MSITITLPHELETQVHHAAQRAGVATSTYVAHLLQRHLDQASMALSATEAELLQQINLGLSEITWQQYHQLAQKLQDATLQPDEQKELIKITDQVEQANVRRLKALIQLAQLRNTTLDQLMDDLGLRPPAYG